MEVLRALARRLAPFIVRAMPRYPPVVIVGGGWQPQDVATDEPWVAQLAAYNWQGQNAQQVTSWFEENAHLWEHQDQRWQLAVDLATWAHMNMPAGANAVVVNQVVITATGLAQGELHDDLGPWGSFWTKIACAATMQFDVLANAEIPQAIWDSRVATAVCDIIDGSRASYRDVQCARSLLFVSTARGNGGIRRRPLAAKTRSNAGWGKAGGAIPAEQLWVSQALGSLIVHEIAIDLNRRKIGHGQWTSFQVGLALFVEGY